MKYQKTINLDSPETQNRLYSGEVKLQRGQWVQSGGRVERIWSVSSHLIWVSRSFKQWCELLAVKSEAS